jgi:hypothetical protein
MKMLAIEKYRNGTVYDFDSNSGISKSVENQIRKLSDTKGYVTIISWDNINNEPISFTYRNGNYIAYYVRGKKGYAEWTVRLSLKVMNYSTE